MKSKFSEQDLKERALELLYGLLDENEAEELRLLIASDATAARIFDEARETVDRFARAARWEEAPEAEEGETAAKNVAVETVPFDAGAAFLFDAFSATVDAETSEAGETNALAADGESSGSNRKRAKRRLKLLRKIKSAAKKERSETGANVDKRGEGGKERRRKKSGKAANFAEPARPASASRRFFGSKERVDGASGWATVGRTSSGDGERRSAARRFWARVPKPTLFQNLIIALAIVALSTALGLWAQETALQARFRDDFRIQIAAPRTLARGESQTIAATTTGPNGKPRRVPIRFSFSDAETGTPLLAHTESGDASGVARFKIPDVADFPARTLLTISAGEREKETFETILTVVDAPKADVGANAAARFAASEAVEGNAAEIVVSTKKNRKEEKKSTAKPASAKRRSASSAAAKERRAPDEEIIGSRSENQKAKSDSFAAFKSGASRSASPSSDVEMGMGGTAMDAGVRKMDASAEAASVSDVEMGMGGTMSGMAAMNSLDAPAEAASVSDVEMGMGGTMSGMAAMNSLDASAEAAPGFSFSFSGFAEDDAAVRLNAAAGLNRETNAIPVAESGGNGATTSGTDAAEKRGLDVRFYPTGGRLVAGRENVVWFECVDEAGRPVVGEFALNDAEGRVATAKTSEGGVGSLRWTPDVDETYSLETAFNGEIAKIVEIGKDGKTSKDDKADKAAKSDKGGEDGSGDDQEKSAAEKSAFAEWALNDVVEDFLPSGSAFETFRFPAPAATVERVAFSVPTRVLENGESVELEIWVKNETPLAATVEKNGVALAQRVWTAKKGRRRVVVPLDENASGVLNVSLWNCARTPFEKIGAAAVYRKTTEAPTLAATLERDEADERALRIGVEPKKGGLGNAESIRLETFWAPTLDAALGALGLDETLLYASDERRAETLGTLALPEANEPILFDNLLEMKESALKKLNAFWLGEAGLAGRVVGLGFLGCAALALLTIFCVLLGALKARRGAIVVLFCAALATFFYFERRRIDFSETLSEAIAVSVDASKAAQKDAKVVATVANAPNENAEDAAVENVCSVVPLRIDDFDAPKPPTAVERRVPLTGNLTATDAGIVLVKLVAADKTLAWKAIPLTEEKVGNDENDVEKEK